MYTSCTSTQVAKLLWNSSLNASLPLQSLIQLGLPFAVYPPFVPPILCTNLTPPSLPNFLKLQKKIIYSSVFRMIIHVHFQFSSSSLLNTHSSFYSWWWFGTTSKLLSWVEKIWLFKKSSKNTQNQKVSKKKRKKYCLEMIKKNNNLGLDGIRTCD